MSSQAARGPVRDVDDWVPKPKGPLRSGYTTGACATAATVGALRALLTQSPQGEVRVRLPAGSEVTFFLESCTFTAADATAGVVKDAGDDPDATHGAVIISAVRLLPDDRVIFKRGKGVGEVTRPGLQIPPGEPAINPVPRAMMAKHAKQLLREFGRTGEGVEITISCPTGEEIAQRTSNPRLGIVGGISILGTTGIVRPFSASSYIASITQGIDVGLATGEKEFVVTVGAKSERFAREMFSMKPEVCFIQMGNFFGATVKHAARTRRVERLIFVGLLAKFSKIAQGNLNLESTTTAVDKSFLWQVAQECGAGPEWEDKIIHANTTREISQIARGFGARAFHDRIAALCVDVTQQTVENLSYTLIDAPSKRMQTEFILIDDQGDVLGACRP